MLATDTPEVLINSTSPDDTATIHPIMQKTLAKHGVFPVPIEDSHEVILAGARRAKPACLPASGKRKGTIIEDELIPPERIVGTVKSCDYDAIQMLPLAGMDEMRWIFFWILKCLPKDRIYTESYETLLELYYFVEPEALDMMRASFLLLMTRVPDVQRLVCCGHFPPLKFCYVKPYNLLTFILGKDTMVRGAHEDSGGDSKHRRVYVGGMYPLTEKVVIRSIEPIEYVLEVTKLVEKGGIHARFEEIMKEETFVQPTGLTEYDF